jgi:predicted dehydrogenase
MIKKYQAVVIGLGNIGARFSDPEAVHPFNHSQAYFSNPNTELVGGCDPDQKNRHFFESAFNKPAYETLTDALSLNPEIVSVCSPHKFHFEQTISCLNAGVKMIFLEKPPVTSLTELSHLMDNEKKFEAKIMVNYQRRYSPNYIALKNFFNEEKLGRPKAIQIFYSQGLEKNGCHMLDVAFFITKDQGKIKLTGVNAPFGDNNPSFSFTSNSFPIFVTGLDLPFHCVDIIAFFEKGRATIDHLGLNSKMETVIENEYFPGFYRLADASPDFQVPSGGLSIYFATAALEDLINAYEHAKHPVSSLKTASQTQEIIEKIRSQI